MQTFKLFSIMLVGLIGLSFSSLEASDKTPKIEGSGDTVIIKFGENSNLQLYIDSDEDRKTLSELDLNALVDKINAYMSEQKNEPEPIYSEAHPAENEELTAKAEMDVNITTEQPKKDPTLKDVFATKDISELKDMECDDEDKPTKWVWHFDFGFNNYQQNGRAGGAIAHDLKTWRSNYFAVGSSIRTKVGENSAIKVGAEVSWNSLHFKENTLLQNTEDGTVFIEDTFSVDKSKLNVTYLTVPVMFEFGDPKKWTFGVGGHVGYRVGTHFKREYRLEGVNRSDKEYDSFNVQDLRYGLRSELKLGHEGLKVFMNYDLNSFFNGDTSPDLQLLSFGVRM